MIINTRNTYPIHYSPSNEVLLFILVLFTVTPTTPLPLLLNVSTVNALVKYYTQDIYIMLCYKDVRVSDLENWVKNYTLTHKSSAPHLLN